MNKKYNFNNEDVNRIIEEYSINLMPVFKIAKLFSVDGSVIKRVLNENGIKIINGSAFSKKYWMERGVPENMASLKILEMKPCCVEYWTSKGMTIEEAKLQVELHLMNTKRSFIIKYGDKGIELYKNQRIKTGEENSQRNVKYWIKRGYSEKDAIIKVSEIQKTFSKEMWIKKYGERAGIDKINDRNDRWQKSLRSRDDYAEIQKRKDTNSINYYIEKYGESYIKEFIKRQCNFNSDINEKLIFLLEKKNYVGFIEFIKETYDYNGKKINDISNLKIIQIVFNKTKDDIKNDLVKQYPIKNKNSWGTTYIIDGIIFRSLGEVDIYNFLKSKNINFKYDKEYLYQINKKYRYDFYLIDKDIYIEYAGIENIRKTIKTRRIHEEYDSRIKIKRKHCINNGLNHYFSNSVEDIKNFINNTYE